MPYSPLQSTNFGWARKPDDPYMVYTLKPASATDNTVPRFDGTDGHTLQTSTLTVDDGGSIVSLSGASGTNLAFNLGRTAIEVGLCVAASAGQYSTDAVAGDAILRNESSSKLIKMQAGAGASVLNISNTDIYTVTWTSYSPTYYGFTADAFDWAGCSYMKLGRMVYYFFSFLGVSNQDYMRMTLPYTPDMEQSIMIVGWDNTTASQVYAHITGSDYTKLYFYKTVYAGTFTNSNKKGAHGMIIYRTAS